MGMQNTSVQMSVETYAKAERIAALDHVPVSVLIESLVKRHAEYIDSLDAYSDMPRFSLDDYEMVRAPGEADEDYQARMNLFR